MIRATSFALAACLMAGSALAQSGQPVNVTNSPLPVIVTGALNVVSVLSPSSLIPNAWNSLDGSSVEGSQQPEACHLIKANPGVVAQFTGHVIAGSASTVYFFGVNANACPGGTTTFVPSVTPLLTVSGTFTAGQTWNSTFWSPIPKPAAVGIVELCSTTDWPLYTPPSSISTNGCIFTWLVE